MNLILLALLVDNTVSTISCVITHDCEVPFGEPRAISRNNESQRFRTTLEEIFPEHLADTPEGAALRMTRPFLLKNGSPSETTWIQIWGEMDHDRWLLFKYDFLSLFPIGDLKKLPAILRLVGTRPWLSMTLSEYDDNVELIWDNFELIDLLMDKPFYKNAPISRRSNTRERSNLVYLQKYGA